MRMRGDSKRGRTPATWKGVVDMKKKFFRAAYTIGPGGRRGILLTKPGDEKFGDRRLYFIAKRELQRLGMEDQPIQIGPWYYEWYDEEAQR